MAAKTLHVKLTGAGQLHQPSIQLENIAINIWSIDGGVTWENKGVQIDVTGALQIYMTCKAITGTTWEFIVEDKVSSKKCYDENGTTGEPLASRNGQRIANFSERDVSVNC